MTLLAEVVETLEAVAATSSRLDKRAALAALLRRLPAEEVPVVIGLVLGQPRQGRVGVGWATIRDIDPAAAETESSVTVADVDDVLSRVADTTGSGSQAVRLELLQAVFARASSAEQAFLARVVGGEVRTGALAGVVTDAVAEASGVPAATVRRASMLAGDLGEVAALALGEGVDAVRAVGLRPLRPVLPMLATTASSVEDAVAALGRVSVEWKLDGARIQVHRRGDEVRVFTRNCNDVTARLPEVVAVASSLAADVFVLDGEVLGFTGPDQTPETFQDTMSRFGRDDAADGDLTLVPQFFDLLHLAGTDVLDEPLEARRARLAGLVGPHLVPGRVTADPVEAQAVLDEALARGHEGVMVKGADSTYDAGHRGKAWRKVKPVHTFDLVVLAAEWGHGRRSGLLSNLHLGARDPRSGGFVMVGKTFKGLTDAMLAWQTDRFLELEERRDRGTVWVRPEQVVEVAIDGVQTSSRYPGGVALRFARVRGYRSDKAADASDTIDALQALRRDRPVTG